MPIGIALAVIRSKKILAPVMPSAVTITLIVNRVMNPYSIIADNNPTSYDCTTLPLGLILNKTTGIITGTPTVIGTTAVTLTVKNQTASVTQILTIIVNPDVPVVTSEEIIIFRNELMVDYQIQATYTPTSYNCTTLPAGLILNQTTGVIKGTPTTLGVTNVTLSATNITGTGIGTLKITVVIRPPVITNTILEITKTINLSISPDYQIVAINTPTSFNATPLPAGLSINTTTGLISGTPTALGDTTVTISATNSGGTNTKTLIIHIVPPVPVITNTNLAITLIVDTVMTNYQISATNIPTSYDAIGLPLGLVINKTTGVISGTPTVVGITTVTIKASNAGGTGTTKTLTITVIPKAPIITSALAITIPIGVLYSPGYQITADNIPTSFNATPLPAGLAINKTTGVISGTPTVLGATNVTITATNGGGTDTKILVITVVGVTPKITNTILDIFVEVNIPITTIQIGALNIPTSFDAKPLPAGLSINKTNGQITGTPTVVGDTSVILTAINTGGTSAPITLVIHVLPSKPVITGLLSITITLNKVMTNYQINASGNPTSYSAATLPPGLALDAASGIISGTPTVLGTTNVTITATNLGGTDTKTLTIIVIAEPPVITSSLNLKLTRNVVMTNYQIVATNNPTVYAGTPLPAGLTINNNNGIISGTPTALGVTNVIIKATNSGGTDTKTLVITVVPPIPVITNTVLSINVIQNVPMTNYQITASNNPTSFSTGTLPSGLTCSTAGIISGRPNGAIGAYPVAINASNAGGTGTNTLIINVIQPAPVVTSDTLTLRVNVAMTPNFQIVATNNPTSYSAVTLPTGLTLNSVTGVISGTPTIVVTTTVIINASNTAGTGSLIIVVLPSDPVVSSGVKVLTLNVAMTPSFQIVATNNPTSFDAIGLPAGLVINKTTGVISGTPTVLGTTNVTIKATNSGGTGQNTLNITVNPPAPVITSSLTSSGTQGSAYNYQITATNNPTSFASSGLPSGLSMTASGVIFGTPTVGGVFNVNIQATNAGGTGTATLKLTITPLPPVINSALTYQKQGNESVAYTITATNNPTSYTATRTGGLPTGLTFTGANISGICSVPGVYNITITATNAGGTGTATLVLTIVDPPPVVISNSVTIIKGVATTFQVQTQNNPTNYVASGLPNGLIINANNGLISGTPSTLGAFVTNVSVSNAAGNASGTISFTVVDAVPVVTAATVTWTPNTNVSHQIVATNNPTNYSIPPNSLGITCNPTTGVISGKFLGTAGNTYSTTMRAWNTNPTVGFNTLTINTPPLPPTPSYPSNIEHVQNVPGFSYQMNNSGGVATSWTMTNVPGLSISNTGKITGTPTVIADNTVTITCSNTGGTGSFSFLISITKPVPVISGTTALNVIEGTSVTLNYSASNGPITRWDSSGTDGLSFTSSGTTAKISGTISTKGFNRDLTIGVFAWNSTGRAIDLFVTFTITKKPTAPTIRAVDLSTETWDRGRPHGSCIGFTGDAPTSTTMTGIPNGLMQTGGECIVGTGAQFLVPTTATTGTHIISITMTNAGGSSTGVKRIIIT